jgi:hypothetical protein
MIYVQWLMYLPVSFLGAYLGTIISRRREVPENGSSAESMGSRQGR